MIPILPYAIGFVVYIFFILTTFKTYSLKKEMTKSFSLLLIYVYYTLLAFYLIGVVDGNSGTFVVFIQGAIYALIGGFVSFQHYKDNIKPLDDKMYGQNV